MNITVSGVPICDEPSGSGPQSGVKRVVWDCPTLEDWPLHRHCPPSYNGWHPLAGCKVVLLWDWVKVH